MNTPASLDIHVSILKQVDQFGSETYRTRIVIGKRQLIPEPNTEEVFWCCASGRNFFNCVNAVRERALCWTQSQLIKEVTGLTDSETTPVTLNMGKNSITIAPVTYNDWFLEPHLV